MEKHNQTLMPGEIYHVYNRAVGDELLFKNEKDYQFFLIKLIRFIVPVAKIYCYCLLPNHFHFLVEMRVLDESISTQDNFYTKAFSNFFNSYARSYNNVHQRKGKLFMLPYKRVHVDEEGYFINLVVYIHRNPIHHGYAKEYLSWKFSSFNLFLNTDSELIEYNEVMNCFDGIDDFIALHEENKNIPRSNKYEIE